MRGLPPNGFTFTPTTFTLASGATQTAGVAVTVTDDAPTGPYTGLLSASIVDVADPDQSAPVRVGASAATRLQLDVASRPFAGRIGEDVSRWLDDTTPWGQAAAVAVALAVGDVLLSRRFRVRVERLPRT